MDSRARFAVLAGVLALTGCGTSAKRKPVAVQPSPVTPVPAVSLAQPTRPVVPPPPRPLQDEVSQVIERAESIYKAGVEDYRSGNTDSARAKFDEAVEILLDPALDAERDERLSGEFEKLVEEIHGTEVAALEQGEVLREHRYEPAPIESLQGLTFPVDPNVERRVQQEVKSVQSDLPLASNDLVTGVISYFQNRGSDFIYKVLTRVGQYQGLISDVLRQEGIPQDLIYLAAAESGFNPFAKSRKSAVGMWQFVLGTAYLYGLRKDRWVDEREDPVKSTQAAARHLKGLYRTFGDWYLAMAAYDTGPGTVQKAIEKTGYADFWRLRKLHALPSETENYVPIIVATALIAKDPEAFGFDIRREPPLEVDRVVVKVPTDLRLVAELIEHPVEELIRLNPSMLAWTTPPNTPEFVLYLSKGTAQAFEMGIAKFPADKRIWWRTHKVGGGETLSSIAKNYRVSSLALARANLIEGGAPIEEGARLILPLAAGSESSLVRIHERAPRRAIRYRIRPGDTLELIADRFDVTPYEIRRWNQMKTSDIVAGKSLKIYSGGGGSGRSSRPRRSGTSAAATGRELAKKKTAGGKSPQARLSPANQGNNSKAAAAQ